MLEIMTADRQKTVAFISIWLRSLDLRVCAYFDMSDDASQMICRAVRVHDLRATTILHLPFHVLLSSFVSLT